MGIIKNNINISDGPFCFKRLKKIFFFVLVAFLFFSNFSLFSQILKLKVTVKWGNVREKPSVKSNILTRFSKNSILTALEKSGDWFKVQLEKKEKKEIVYGYIHKSIVQVVGEKVDQKVEERKKKLKGDNKPDKKKGEEKIKSINIPVKVGLKDMRQLLFIEKEIRKESIAFLTLIKKMLPKDTGKYKLRTVEMVRVIKDMCSVYETENASSRIIYNPRLNDTYEILAKDDVLYKIRLLDGRKGWIRKDCIQLFVEQKRETKVKFLGLKSSEVKKFIELASDIFSRIVQHKLVADQIIKKYQHASASRITTQNNIFFINNKIKKYYKYSQSFYEKYVKDSTTLLSKDVLDLSRISAWAELLMGHSNYESKYLSSSSPEQDKGSTRSISLGGNMILNKSSKLNVAFSNKRDIIQTPFSTTNFTAGYSYSDKKKLRINGGINLNSYNDESNEINNFQRFTFRANADYTISAKTNAFFNLSFLKNNFKKNKNNNFSTKLILAGVDLKVDPKSRFIVQLRTNFESSDSEFHQFTDIEPSISYIRTGLNSRMNLKFLHERLSFKDLQLKDYNRTALFFRNNKNKKGAFSNLNFSVTSKSFPNNDRNDYIQLTGNYSSSKFENVKRNTSASFYTNLFTNNPSNSFTDFRFDFGGIYGFFFNQVSAFVKMWHDPGGDSGYNTDVVKPYVIDLYLNLGINTKYIRVGPTFGLHALISSEMGVNLIKRDGNLIRVGAMVEMRLPLPKGIRFTLYASSEYGFVYSNEIGVDINTGDLTTGEVIQRHPVTIQINSTITVPLFNNFEFFGQGNYYKINTDMDQKLSINPVEYNKRFIILFGIKYRYN